MANIKSMEMARALSAHPHISTRKGFLGLSTQFIYTPTQSRLSGQTLDFDAETGKRVKRVLAVPVAEWAGEIDRAGQLKPTKAMGNVLVELCTSTDGQFAAVQVLQYTDLSYQPVAAARFFEGEEAEQLLRLFVR